MSTVYKKQGGKQRPVRVLVVDDSRSAREFLSCLIESDEHLEVAGTASNGEQALSEIRRLKPDLVTMDINMPGWDGFKITRHIMETQPLPIVIVSSHYDPLNAEKDFQALQAGAIAILPKPPNPYHTEYKARVAKLLRTIKSMSQVRVIKRQANKNGAYEANSLVPGSVLPRPTNDIRVIAIGASTGGPVILQQILSGLPADFTIPILIVQHIASGFLQGMLNWLNNSVALKGIIPRENTSILGGGFYLAPEDLHLGLGYGGLLQLENSPLEYGGRPSVAHLFRSVAELYGSRSVGILLSGMGRDGALEMNSIREKGGITIAQNEDTALIYGMPGEAVKLGAAAYIMTPDQILEFLCSLKK